MDSSSRSSSRSGRRSFPNLTHLSLAPLSSRFPIDDDGLEESESQNHLPTSSYIQGKSAPTTPGILAGPSRPKSKKKQIRYAHDSHLLSAMTPVGAPMVKAKSASALSYHNDLISTPEGLGSPLHTRTLSRPNMQSNEEWLHRAGLVIASETRESKGQSWLTSRASSTSLVQPPDDYDEDVHSRHGSEDGPGSAAHSRKASRAASRANSARPSRRASRVGSKVDFVFTPFDREFAPESAAIDGYFDLAMEPDFVDKEDEEAVAADAEVHHLAHLQGSGLGGLFDRMIGWPLFNVDEDSEDDIKMEAEETAEELQRRRQRELRRRKEELAKAASSSASATAPKVVIQPPAQNQNDEGGWSDVAWLLSVASKIVL